MELHLEQKKIGFINAPIKGDSLYFQDKNKEMFLSNGYLPWNENKDVVQIGIKREEKIYELLMMLEGIIKEESYISSPGSYLDRYLGIDIVAKFTDVTYGFQVKSSYKNAIRYVNHWRNELEHVNKGVLYVTDYAKPIEILTILSSWLDKPVKENIQKLILTTDKFKGLQIVEKSMKLTNYDKTVLKKLGLVKSVGGILHF